MQKRTVYKKSTNQTFTFISCKVLYFKKHLTYQVLHPQEVKFHLPLNVTYHCHTIKLAVGTIAI